MTTRAPYPTYAQRHPRGRWRVGDGFQWWEAHCSGGHGGECPLALEELPRRLPAHHIGRRRQEQAQGKAWGLVCIFSSVVDWREVRA